MMSYAYDTIADIIRLGEENNISFGDVVLRYELENYDRSEDAVVREIENRLDIFERWHSLCGENGFWYVRWSSGTA